MKSSSMEAWRSKDEGTIDTLLAQQGQYAHYLPYNTRLINNDYPVSAIAPATAKAGFPDS